MYFVIHKNFLYGNRQITMCCPLDCYCLPAAQQITLFSVRYESFIIKVSFVRQLIAISTWHVLDFTNDIIINHHLIPEAVLYNVREQY